MCRQESDLKLQMHGYFLSVLFVSLLPRNNVCV